jgi:outer membrane protein OmpA-like peptidoglycan-associated protein
MTRKIIFLFFVLNILVSCTSLEALKKTEPKGNAFQNYLFHAYRTFAEDEADKYDWIDSQHFAHKAKQAAYGQNVGPEELSNWRLPAEKIIELNEAREKLLHLLKNKYITNKYAHLAAKTQVAFDRWVEEEEEKWQLDEIWEAKESFFKYLSELENSKQTKQKSVKTQKLKKEKISDDYFEEDIKPKKGKKKKNKGKKDNKNVLHIKDKKKKSKKNKKKEAVKYVETEEDETPIKAHIKQAKLEKQNKRNRKPKKVDLVKALPKDKFEEIEKALPKEKKAKKSNKLTSGYVINFDPEGSTPLEREEEKINQLIKEAKKSQVKNIVINSYATISKDEDKNLKLSKKRASLLKKRLQKAGLKSNVTIFAFGDPEIDTSQIKPKASSDKLEINIVD